MHQHLTLTLTICVCHLIALSLCGQPSSPNNTTPTPVVLTFFQGKHHHKQYNELLWQTAQEINAAYFSVEKSTDGLHFTALGRVKAQGNKDTPTEYKFLDEECLGVNYYRLKQVDFDATFYYSSVISIEGEWVSIQSQNPFRESLSININSVTEWSWKVSTASGKHLHQGNGTGDLLQLNTKKWPIGIYFIEICSGAIIWSKRLVKE